MISGGRQEGGKSWGCWGFGGGGEQTGSVAWWDTHAWFFSMFFFVLGWAGKGCMIMTDIGISTPGWNILLKLIPRGVQLMFNLGNYAASSPEGSTT